MKIFGDFFCYTEMHGGRHRDAQRESVKDFLCARIKMIDFFSVKVYCPSTTDLTMAKDSLLAARMASTAVAGISLSMLSRAM